VSLGQGGVVTDKEIVGNSQQFVVGRPVSPVRSRGRLGIPAGIPGWLLACESGGCELASPFPSRRPTSIGSAR
jgi:hypothetical protein